MKNPRTKKPPAGRAKIESGAVPTKQLKAEQRSAAENLAYRRDTAQRYCKADSHGKPVQRAGQRSVFGCKALCARKNYAVYDNPAE